ncbi:MAG: hypothetical protein JNM12_13290 [Alphaproteobacteria bacterium]|nr:hypothetical protein [Alphaproteobacteria bacterium]
MLKPVGPMKLLKKIGDFYEDFYTTLAEGHYRAEPLTIWTLIKPPAKQKMPGTSPVEVGTRMLDTSQMVGKRFMWASIFAALSIKTLTTTAIGFGVAGVSLLALEYRRSKSAAAETITEVNFAGQTVTGTRRDLYRLHKAQEQIMKLTDSFKQASMESTTDTINRIIDSVKEHRARVTVIDGGRYGAKTGAYEFSEPAIKLVEDDNGVKISRPYAAAPAFVNDNLKRGFNAAAQLSDQEVVERLLALHDALPPHLASEVEKRMAAARNAPPPLQSALF